MNRDAVVSAGCVSRLQIREVKSRRRCQTGGNSTLDVYTSSNYSVRMYIFSERPYDISRFQRSAVRKNRIVKYRWFERRG